MKFYIYSTKENAEKELTRLEKLVRKLYRDAEVEFGKNKLPKYKEDKLEAEGVIILKVESVLLSSNKETAYTLMSKTGIGVSERVLNSL